MTFNDENIPKWQIFSRVWNEIVVELRSIDLLSDAELGNLLFVQLCTSMPGIKVMLSALLPPLSPVPLSLLHHANASSM